jgi:hypothetical protein
MIDLLTILLRVAGVGLILLAILHVPIGRYLKWGEEGGRLSLVNASIFRVHAFFICVLLVMMGLPCLLEPTIFLEPSRAGGWLAWSFSGFWAIRLYVQWFVYPWDLWRGRRMETGVHIGFTGIWIGLTGLFAACGFWQSGWLR